jgi:hypothetical protein
MFWNKISWDNVTLYKFQRIDEINKRDISELDKTLFTTCVVFDKTEFELDNMPPQKALKYVSKVEKIFRSELKMKPGKKAGKFPMVYDPSALTFGQFIELVYFLQDPILNAHYVLASIVSKDADTHRQRSEYFHSLPVGKVMGCFQRFIENFEAFQKEYKSLFGLDEEVSGTSAQVNQFNKRYGWIYSASQVAEYERITLDQAFALPIRRALNDLAYLKAKAKYESELLKQNNARK